MSSEEAKTFVTVESFSSVEEMDFESASFSPSPLFQTENEMPLSELVRQLTFSGSVPEKQGLVVESLLQTGSQPIPTISGLV